MRATRSTLTTIAAVTLLGALATACSAGPDSPGATSKPAPGAAQQAERLSATAPLDGPCEAAGRGCEQLLSAHSDQRDEQRAGFRPAASRDHWLYVDCQGEGALTVDVAGDSVEVPCADRSPGVTGVRHQFGAGTLPTGYQRVTVSGDDNVRWSLAVVAGTENLA
ncbi:hypothetical protein GL263_09705 [Streptomyces durbertensis]|uniref:Lipoprotein n=1 Tax=Streptomyces durbertensis TaxID=2448886 RepID=A0ABR6EET5_9ACTN|nr:hypothetical protein [Streptomyces durbertensis]MBB1243831.1 hypothetical protein [Streptomyces durbertensis]